MITFGEDPEEMIIQMLQLRICLLFAAYTVQLSCSDGVHETTADVATIDTLSKVSAQPSDEPYSELYSTLFSIDTSKGLLGTLYYSDTLILRGIYSECGEFGGHSDWLRIYFDQGNVLCSFHYEPPACASGLEKVIEKEAYRALYTLTRENEIAVLEYLNKLTQLSFRYQYEETNVMNIYTADISEPKNVPSLHRFNVLCYDLSLRWSEFDELKRTIRTSANMLLPQSAPPPGDNSR